MDEDASSELNSDDLFQAVEKGDASTFEKLPEASLTCKKQVIKMDLEAKEEGKANGKGTGEEMEGFASIALLPNGSISGHFIRMPDSVCYGLHGTEISCERECSRGEDYRLIKLSIIDYSSKREKVVVVECKGHDAARLQNVDHVHGWEEDIIGMVEKENKKENILISFECETLKAENAAEDHIRKYMPNLSGLDAVVNIGRMCISGISFKEEDNECNEKD
ncbi:hypothetical protein LUZ60_010139 [Juncus effusus]|nr:hypothetical protein LUZ60_010139 [Juncus effusus]